VHIRRLMSLIILVMLMVVPSVVQAQVGVVATVEQNVSLRVGAGTEWRRIDILQAGTTIALDGRESTGTWVRGITQNGQVGWVAANYLSVSNEGVFALPVIDREAPITVGAPAPGVVSAPAVPTDSSNSAPAPSAPVEGGTTVTATANLNMRSGPSTEYRRVGALRNGQTLNVDGRDSSIGWVRGVNASGDIGWISARYINLDYNAVASLPVVNIDTPFGLSVPSNNTASNTSATTVDIQPIVSTAPVRGFAYGGHIRGFDAFTVDNMRRAGMTWAKKQVRYFQGGDPNGVAGEIATAHANGFRILLGVVGDPGQLNNPNYFNDYANFVAGLAALGADAIEIWNEPNIDREWPAGQIDPARYTQLLATSYNAIKGVNPNTLVVSGAPAPTGFFGGCSANGCDDGVYIAGMAAAGAANYMDCVGVHYNEGIVPPNQTSGDPRSEFYTRYYPTMVSTYYNAFGGRVPLCFTELGYLSPEGIGSLPGGFAWAQNVTVAQQAAWLDQVVSTAARSGVVRLLIIWNVDFREYGADPMGGYAIIRPDGSCPACDALGR
jgi:uncharacterized protein YraI